MPKVFERSNGLVYERDFGRDPATRQAIGTCDPTQSSDPLDRHSWSDVLLASRSNPALQDALLRAIIIYELSKPNE